MYLPKIRGALAVLALVASLTRPALAADRTTEEDRVVARELFFDGQEKRRAGDLEGAYLDLAAADGIMGVPTTALRLAEVQIARGHLVEAHEALERALRYTSAQPLPGAFIKAQAAARSLEAKLRPRLASVEITIAGVATEGPVVVSIDNHALPQAALTQPYLVDPGRHNVTLAVAGAPVDERQVFLGEGESLALSLGPPPTAKAPGRPAIAEPAIAEPAASTHAPAFRPLRKPPASSNAEPQRLLVGGIVVAGLGIGVGAVTGLFALQRTAIVRAQCPNHACPPAAQETLIEAEALATASTTSFIVAGVGVAIAIGSYLVGPHPSTASIRTAPVVTSDGFGTFRF